MVTFQNYRAFFIYFYLAIKILNIGSIFFQDRGFLSQLIGNTEDCERK